MPLYIRTARAVTVERPIGIEPTSSAWKAEVIAVIRQALLMVDLYQFRKFLSTKTLKLFSPFSADVKNQKISAAAIDCRMVLTIIKSKEQTGLGIKGGHFVRTTSKKYPERDH